MKTILTFIAALCAPFRHIVAANEDEITVANALGGEGVFEVQQGNEMFIPYGEYQHAVGLQKFTKQSAEAMVTAFNSAGGLLKRLFTKPGVPIYPGHPDIAGRPDYNPAAPALGWVESIVAGNDGMTLGVKWNADGEKAVTGAQFRFYSPVWQMKRVAGGVEPVKLQSVGLTNNPRIPVPALANDDTPAVPAGLAAAIGLEATASFEDVMKAVQEARCAINRFRDLLYMLGIEDANATAETITAAARALKEKADKLGAAENDLAAAITARDAAKQEAAKALADLTAANDAVKAARAARADDALALAVTAGRVLAAERDAKRAELLTAANDEALGTAIAALYATAPKLKTAPVAKNLGAEKSKLITAANDASAAIREAVDAELGDIKSKTPGIAASVAYDLATKRARAKRPELFA